MRDPHTIIRTLELTEKGTRLKEIDNKFFFEVAPDANKIEIKQAVEQLFKVHVTGVNTLNRQGKRKRLRTMHYGKTSAWKRAVVTLKDGETIDLT